MQLYLLSFPLWLLFVVLVLGSALFAASSSWLVGHLMPGRPADNDVGVAFFQVVGAIFGFILAFTISAVYDEFEDAARNVSQEAAALSGLYRLALELPEQQRTGWQHGLEEYAELVVGGEWRAMSQGGSSLYADLAVDHLWSLQRRFVPETAAQLALAERLYEQLLSLTHHRRNRLDDSRQQLAPLIWAQLLAGGSITLALAIFLRSANNRSQCLMTALLAAVIGLGLLLVMALDCPFGGSMHVSPDAIRDALKLFQRLHDN